MLPRTIHLLLLFAVTAFTWAVITEPVIAAPEDAQPPVSAYLDQVDAGVEVSESDGNGLAIFTDVPRCQQERLIYRIEFSPRTAYFTSRHHGLSRDPPAPAI